MKNYWTVFTSALFYISVIGSAMAELNDPSTRDEDISFTQVNVDIQQNQEGNYIYRYSVTSPPENKGKVASIAIDLSCDANFDNFEPSYSVGKEGHIDLNQFSELIALKEGEHSPADVSADYGSAGPHGISIENDARWGIVLKPGESTMGLQIISPAEPGMRIYTLEPSMETFGWDYPEDPDPAHPWIEDFTVYGMIAGPGCPGVTPPVDIDYYPGTEFGPKDLNGLLTYSTPLKDRFHVDAEINEVEITIHYSKLIDPKTFKVEPGWARPFFNPEPGGSDTVMLHLKQAMNKFKFKVSPNKVKGPRKGNEEHYSYHDTDLFEIRRDAVKKGNLGTNKGKK